jgi:hypothetical protein
MQLMDQSCSTSAMPSLQYLIYAVVAVYRCPLHGDASRPSLSRNALPDVLDCDVLCLEFLLAAR